VLHDRVVYIRVLGSAAGGGFPQWNCACPNCAAVRAGDARVQARTQDSLAVSADGVDWAIVNASPDILRQIERSPFLYPRSARHSPIRAIVLTNGDLDHVLGLFSLRESWPLVIYATSAVRRGLEDGNAVFRTLRRFPEQVTWRPLALGVEMPLLPGLTLQARAAVGKLPVHLVGTCAASEEDNVALWIRDERTGKRAAYVGATATADGLEDALGGVDCVFFDGTFWSSDELIGLGLSTARAEDMAHVPVGGKAGSLAKLAFLQAERKVYTHINNSTPMLVEGSNARRAVERAGWEVAHDGMEIVIG
jgi:pyrroloquinoline quinone biosynthesis protein B